MVLEVQNVGRFSDAVRIEINGITVLAGENGTGKSTLGKALFCIFNSMYDYKSQVSEERERSIFRNIRILNPKQRTYANMRKKIRELIELKDTENIDEHIQNILSEIAGIEIEKVDDSVVKKCKDIISASETSILAAMLLRRIDGEFDSQMGHVLHREEPSIIKLIIKDKPVEVTFDKDGEIKVKEKINLVKDLVYIDDPYVIDDLSGLNLYSEKNHRQDIIDKLTRKKDRQYSAVDDVLLNEKLKTVYKMLEDICEGSLSLNEEENTYSDSEFGEGISVKNLSTGMKGFVILKSLLQKGYLEENGIVILDEPEAHLHPEWMIKYAEIVVLLQKNLDINFLVSTHSSEFLSYLELYTRKHSVLEKCKYYLLQNDQTDETKSVVVDCSNDLEKIYKKLSRPYLWASRKLDEEV